MSTHLKYGTIFTFCYHGQLSEIAYFFGFQKVSLKTAIFPAAVDIFFDLPYKPVS
jgi:hypothetical protein